MRGTQRFWLHAAALLAVLVAAAGIVGTRASFLPDEGVTILQARMLSSGQGWLEQPALLARVDPAGEWYPLDNADHSARGFAPFAKHPLYAELAAGVYWIGGVPGIVFLSILGTFAAALIGAALAHRLDPRLAVPALWALGVASPLLFDSSMAVGHTLGVALCGGAALVVIAGPIRGKGLLWRIPVVGACLGLAVLIRSEALLFGIAVAAAGVAYAALRRQAAVGVLGAGALAGALLGRKVETAWRWRILGSKPAAAIMASSDSSTPGSFLSNRVLGFRRTWLDPSHLSVPRGDALLIALWALTAAFALLVRRRHPDVGLVGLVTCLLVVASVARLAISPRAPVPGLLVAFPLLWGGLLAIWGSASDLEWLALGIAGVFSAAVIATQYSVGGSLEWGGRYFALALPVAVPPVLAVMRRRGLALPAGVRRVAVVGVIVPSLAISVLAVWSLHDYHRDSGRLVSAIDRLGGPTPGGVVVTNVPWLGRISWRTYPHQQWLYVPPADMPVAAGEVAGAGVGRVTVVTIGTDCRAAAFPGWHVVGGAARWSNGRLFQITNVAIGSGPSSCAGTQLAAASGRHATRR